MKSKLTLTLLLVWITLIANGQTRNINDNWNFVRLTDGQATWTAKNQGSDWSSQFNVEHITQESGALAVPADTIAAELSLLRQARWEDIRLPHTAYVEPLVVQHPWQGICYYRRTLRVSPREAASRLWIEFEGAMQLADIWINGRHVKQHAGGFTTFLVDATGLLRPDRDNELLVRLDNRDNPLIPPGKPLAALDFCYHSGIYRDVNLIARPNVHITHPLLAEKAGGGGNLVTYPQVSDQRATVRIQTEVANGEATARHLTLTHTLRPWSRAKGAGRAVAMISTPLSIESNKEQTTTTDLSVDQPLLWSPDAPQLYQLETEVRDGRHLIDRRETRIGIRRFEISRERGCLINGQPVRLVGSNRHMEYPYVGNAISDAAQRRDIRQIRNSGFNIVRLGHYPQDPSILEACDEMGLLVIEPIPGWQFYNKNQIFNDLTYQSIRELIRRDRNHPSILMWETTLNESWPPNAWKDTAIAVAHAEKPEGECFTSGDMYGYHGFDISYNDWSDKNFSRPNDGPKPGFIREYYDYEFGGHYSTSRIGRRHGQAALVQNLWNAQWSHNRNRGSYPWTMGDAVWSMYDYNRGCADNICESGVADLFRLPKYSLSFYRTQTPAGTPMPDGPMPHELFIASRWEATASDTLIVLGNVDEVELRLNGRTLARRQADKGPSTDYTPHADGGNCRNLNFPPFTFTGIRWQAGTLTAIGYENGREVTRTAVTTPGQPDRIALSYFESGEAAERNDLIIVYVSLLDANGTLCPINDIPVTLSAEGGTVIGPTTYNTEAGIASFLVQTSDARRLNLQASCREMTTSLKLKLKASRKPGL